MNDFLPFVLIGITSGSVYGLAGVGLVLTYRTSGVFNFAHGAIATAGAYLFYELWVKNHLAWPLAAIISITIVGLIAGLLMEVLSRSLSRAPASVVVVATVGLLLLIQGIATIRYGAGTFAMNQFLPSKSFTIGGLNIGQDQLVVVLVGIGVSAGLAFLLARTRIGVAMRGVVDDSELMELTGYDGTKVRRVAWMIGGGVAALSGVLLAPFVGLDPVRLTFLVVEAFSAAAIGRFRSLPATFIGGAAIGIVASLGQKYAADYPALLGFPSSVPFIALFGVLIVVGKRGLPRPPAVKMIHRERLTPVTKPVRVFGAIVIVLILAVLPHVVGARLPVYTNAAGFVILFASLGLLVKTAGQVSLCHGAFVAVGAVAFSRLSVDLGLPWFLALIGAGLIAMPIGLLIALPAVRLSGIYLALATFAFGLLMENLVYRTFLMFGTGLRVAPRPSLPGLGHANDKEYFYVAIILMLLALAALTALLRSRMGRLLGAMSDSPLALSTFGTGTTTTLVLLFAISAFTAGIAGGVIAAGTGAAGAAGLGSLQSLLWLAIISITGASLVRSAVLAGLLLAVLPSYLPENYLNYQPVGFGVLAVGAALYMASHTDLAARCKVSVASTIRVRTRSRVVARRADLSWRRAGSERSLSHVGDAFGSHPEAVKVGGRA